MTDQEKARASMEALKHTIKESRYNDALGAMKTIKEEDRSDFFKAFYWELNDRLNTGDNQYIEIVNKLNKAYKKQ